MDIPASSVWSATTAPVRRARRRLARHRALGMGAEWLAVAGMLASACSRAERLPKLAPPIGQSPVIRAPEVATEPVRGAEISKVAGHDAPGERAGVRLCDMPDTPAEALLFATDDVNLRERETQMLDDLIACWNAGLFGEHYLHLTGFSDPRGSPEHNHALGMARARAVRRYLIRRGLPLSRISVHSVGARDARGNGPETWTFDRRVEITARPERWPPPE